MGFFFIATELVVFRDAAFAAGFLTTCFGVASLAHKVGSKDLFLDEVVAFIDVFGRGKVFPCCCFGFVMTLVLLSSGFFVFGGAMRWDGIDDLARDEPGLAWELIFN